MAKKIDFMSGFNQATQNLPISVFSEQEKIKRSLVIIDELKRFIPPLTSEEYNLLEANLLEHGCKDPLTIWETSDKVLGEGESENQKYVVLDGHNRFEICKKNELDFKISTPLKFDSIDAAKDYMINHQLGRRNLNPEQISYFRGLKYLSLKKEKGKYDREEHNGKIYHYEKSTTAQDLAAEFNISEKTIRNDALFAKSVENLPTELRTEVLQGKSNLTKAEVIELGREENRGEENILETKKSPKIISAKEKILIVIKQNSESISKFDCEEVINELKQIIDKIK